MDDLSFGLDEDDEPQETPPEESQPFKELRKHARSLEKELKELRGFKEAYDREKAEQATASVFSELELDPSRARWFKADNPDAEITKDTVKKWAVSAGFLQAEDAESEKGFVPTVLPGASLDAHEYTSEEFTELYLKDPDRARTLYERGRINLDKLPGSA